MTEAAAPDVPEVTPRRIPHTDAAGIKAELNEQGFACVRQPAIVLRSGRQGCTAPQGRKRQRACEPFEQAQNGEGTEG
eukprot:COSAG04_NODE_9597_length_849_cov_0.774667_2_plen_78_part_00